MESERLPLNRHRRLIALVSAGVVSVQAGVAAPLKVDISNSGRPLAEGLDPAFTDWATTQNWFAGGNTTSRTFSDGTIVTFTRTGPVGTALKTGYWKAGVQSTAYDVRLSADGLKVDTPDASAEAAGSQIEMRIAGLSAGAHTLLLYLNNWDGTTSNAPLDILVNGTQVVNDLPVSTQVTDNNNAATAYLNLTAVAGQDLVVLIKAETSGSQTSKNVHINGFEIDTPNTRALANTPVPAHADEHVDADSGSVSLTWKSALAGAASHNVYFGVSESAVTSATTTSPEYKGNQTGNSYPVSGINVHLTYYWRIDEVAANGTVTKGGVWMFRPRRLAFPGAEGYGRFARGGRGGVVRHVTNLNDSGAGSLRDAVEGNYGPRTIVFDVGGLIDLQDDITINGDIPYITLAGQTAPGKGIMIKRQQLSMSGARDVNFRFVRLFVGKESGETQNATGMAGVDHCIMDHVSAGWGIDEGLSTRNGKNLTFQRSMIAEMLNVAGHDKKLPGAAHGYAASIGGDVGSFHHNFLVHNEGRNWSMAGGLDGAGYYAGKLDLFNNAVYNWKGRTTDGGAMQVNFVNNYYKRGPANGITTLLNPDYGGFPGKQQYYMAGNILQNGSTLVTDQTTLLDIGTESGGTLPQNSTPPYSAMVSTPFFPSYATIHTAANAFKQVVSDSGCNLPMLDNHQTRLINEAVNGTTTYTGSVSGIKGLPDTTADVGGWENYGNYTRPAGFDTDGDGMPDWWETIKGTNPNSPANNFSESNSDTDGDGYTALEEYLNWMALPNYEIKSGSTVDIDLQSLSMGYSKTSPIYTITGPVAGTVSLVSGRYARFTPSTTANALGRFTYTVKDSANDTMTRTVNVRVIATLPTVTIAATDATAGEYGADRSLAFTVTRTGATTAALAVPLVASGTATAGADYSGFAGSVTIPIGEGSAALPLTVLPDSLSEGPETVAISLGSSAEFTPGSPATASATVADNPSQGYFFTAIDDPAKRGPTDDADGDSVANVIEYFTGSDPALAGPGGIVAISGSRLFMSQPALPAADPELGGSSSAGSGSLKVRYQRAKNRPGVSGGLQWSADLSQWFASGQSDGTRAVTFTEAVVSAAGADPETVEATGTITGGEPAKVFVRLEVR